MRAQIGDAVLYHARVHEICGLCPRTGQIVLVCTQWPWVGQRTRRLRFPRVATISYCKDH